MRELHSNFRWWRTGENQTMLVEDGRVVWREPGSVESDAERKIDHGGKTLFPAFIDNHCHILPTGLDLQKLHLGRCESHEDVLEAVRMALPEIEPGKWLLAVHYDQTRYGGIHLTRNELDAISQSTPILLRHVNGHASIANSAALQAANVDDSTPDPAGGSYGRFADGRMNGVLLEDAHVAVTSCAPMSTAAEMVQAIHLASEKMSGLGIACASDMMTGRYSLLEELESYAAAAALPGAMHTRLYLQWGEVFRRDGGFRSPQIEEAVRNFGSEKCRIGGIKIFADGAIGSATAAIYGAYSGAEPQGHSISSRSVEASSHSQRPVSGQLIYSPERLSEMVRIAHEAGFAIAIHSIGDYSTDLVMDAFASLDNARRHRIEHAMLMSDEQIERFAELGCSCSMQPEFLLRFGHSYRRQLGPERTSTLKRFRSFMTAGIPLSFSSDRPIVAGDPRDGVAIAVNRPDGFDPAENITFEEAIDGYTTLGAQINGDSDLMGSLKPGQLAHFRVEDMSDGNIRR